MSASRRKRFAGRGPRPAKRRAGRAAPAPPVDDFALAAGERVPDGVKRLATTQIDGIRTRLQSRLDADAVHEIRKATKRLRALVRLLRRALGERRYRSDNGAFRDGARALSGRRDADVLVATADALADGPGGLCGPALDRLRATVRAARRDAAANGAGAATDSVDAEMARARRRVGRWPIDDADWTTLAAGLERLYRRSRRCWRRAERAPDVEALHEWRKRVKDLRYVLEMLAPMWPAVVGTLAEELDDLADDLGDDHDLAMLRGVAAGIDDKRQRRALVALVDARRAQLQRRALERGRRLHGEQPDAFVRRLTGYWEAWRGETGDERRA